MTRRDAVLQALPGTSEGIARRARMGINGTRLVLKHLQESGEVRRVTRWVSRYGHTYVYYSTRHRPGGHHARP